VGRRFSVGSGHRDVLIKAGRASGTDRPRFDSEQFRSAPRTCCPRCGRLSITMRENSERPSPSSEDRLRIVMAWLAVVGTAFLGVSAFTLVLWRGFRDQAWLSTAQQHFAAVIGLPMSAIAALFIVLVLRIASGPIEVELGPLKFNRCRGTCSVLVDLLYCYRPDDQTLVGQRINNRVRSQVHESANGTKRT
jgi:hypothetical protein